MTHSVLERPARGELLSDRDWVDGEPSATKPSHRHQDFSVSSSRLSTLIPFGSADIVIDEELPEWSRDAIQQISQLGYLGSNWDSYGGKPIDPYCAMAAIQLVLTVLDPSIPSPAVVPLNNGGIQLEWHRRGVDLEIAVHSPTRYQVVMEDERTGDEVESTIRTDFGPLLDMLARVADMV